MHPDAGCLIYSFFASTRPFLDTKILKPRNHKHQVCRAPCDNVVEVPDLTKEPRKWFAVVDLNQDHRLSQVRCRANMVHIRPESGLDFAIKVLEDNMVFPLR